MLVVWSLSRVLKGAISPTMHPAIAKREAAQFALRLWWPVLLYTPPTRIYVPCGAVDMSLMQCSF